MIRRPNRFIFIAALAAALILPMACAHTHTTTATTTSSLAPGTQTSTTNADGSITTTMYNADGTTTTVTRDANGTLITPMASNSLSTTQARTSSVTNPDGSTTMTTYNADGSTTTITRDRNGNLVQPVATNTNGNTTTVTNPDGSVTTTTINADGSTTAVTRSASGAVIAGNPESSTKTTTSVTTGNTATGGTKITTTTTTTTYAMPQTATTSMPATATATVTTAPMASAGQTDLGPSYYGFGHSRNHGRSVDLNLFADWADFNNGANGGGGLPGTIATGNLGANFKNANGYGLSLNAFFAPTLSVELGASRISPSTTFTPTVAGITAFSGTKVRMTPITGTVQWHFLANHSFDPFIGLGYAYVMFNSRSTIGNPGTTGFQSVSFNDRGGPLANAGVSIGFGRSVGLMFDAKYIRLRGNGTTNFGSAPGVLPTNARFDLNPLILSAGLRFGF